MKSYKTIATLIILLAAVCAFADNSNKTNDAEVKNKSNETKNILDKLNSESSKINSLQAKLEYKFIQDPDLFESVTTNTGTLSYLKEKKRSYLRINFTTRQEDDLKPEKYCEDYLFDGIWLTRINYQLKQINMDQFAPEDKPVEVFTLVTNNFPLIGFSDVESLEKDFDIKIVSQKKNKPIHLFLKVKKESKYHEKYTQIDFYLDPKLYLPTKIVAETPENDIYEITVSGLKINKKLSHKVFQVETPRGFDKNITRLKDKIENKETTEKKED